MYRYTYTKIYIYIDIHAWMHGYIDRYRPTDRQIDRYIHTSVHTYKHILMCISIYILDKTFSISDIGYRSKMCPVSVETLGVLLLQTEIFRLLSPFGEAKGNCCFSCWHSKEHTRARKKHVADITCGLTSFRRVITPSQRERERENSMGLTNRKRDIAIQDWYMMLGDIYLDKS